MNEQYAMYGVFDRLTEERVGRLFHDQANAITRAIFKNSHEYWVRYEMRVVQVADAI